MFNVITKTGSLFFSKNTCLLYFVYIIFLWSFFSVESVAIEPITIKEKEQMDYGTLTSENGTCRMNSNASLEGSGGQTCFGVGVRGKFRVFGESNYAIVVTVVAGPSVNGVTFYPEVRGGGSKVLNKKGKKAVKIIGNLVLNNASAGALSISYTLMVNYE